MSGKTQRRAVSHWRLTEEDCMINRFELKNRFLISLLILVLCVSMTVPALAYDPSTLCNGSSGEEVRALQQMLIDLGYLKGDADGIFGNKTEKAVRRFQWKNGLKADGLAGTVTRSALASAKGGNSTPAAQTAAQPQTQAQALAQAPAQAPAKVYKSTTLYNGCSGEEVRVLQQALIDLGYYEGTADGTFGDQTEAAVKAFQSAYGLKADGLAGTKTRTKLAKVQARRMSRGASNSSSTYVDIPAGQVAEISPPEGCDWGALEQKARQELKNGGFSTDGLNYITHFYASKGTSGLRYDYYRLTFYESRDTKSFDWTYGVDFDQNGKLARLETRPWGGGNGAKLSHIDEPSANDVDKELEKKAKEGIKAWLKEHGYSSLVGKVSKLYVSQITFSEDKTETYYTFAQEFMCRVRVLPSIRIDYFSQP